MEEVIQELENKIDRAVGEIKRLKGLLAGAASQKDEIARLESRVAELESAAGQAQDGYQEKLAAFSGKIGDVLKKLDTVI
jgi:FtsZ-binding cell division protein ZapB